MTPGARVPWPGHAVFPPGHRTLDRNTPGVSALPNRGAAC